VHRTARGLDLPDRLGQVLLGRQRVRGVGQVLAPVDADDACALGGEAHRVLAALPARDPGDEHDLVLEPLGARRHADIATTRRSRRGGSPGAPPARRWGHPPTWGGLPVPPTGWGAVAEAQLVAAPSSGAGSPSVGAVGGPPVGGAGGPSVGAAGGPPVGSAGGPSAGGVGSPLVGGAGGPSAGGVG